MERNLWSGRFNFWPLAEALSWRVSEFERSLDDAFSELVRVVQSSPNRYVVATGIMYQHACPDEEIEPYIEWRDPPTSHAVTTFGLRRMPTSAWANVAPVVDEAGRPTNDLKCRSCRLLAWRGIEFLDRYALVNAWLSLIEVAGHVEQAPAACIDLPFLPFSDIKNYLSEIKQRGGAIPAQAVAHKDLTEKFPHHSVPRVRVVEAHQAVFGKLRPGRR